jgi:hypothetical protein
MRKLDLPAVLVVTALSGAATTALVANPGCGGDDEPPVCDVSCVPEGGPGTGSNCMGPDFPCATGPNLDQCPPGCEPEPVA